MKQKKCYRFSKNNTLHHYRQSIVFPTYPNTCTRGESHYTGNAGTGGGGEGGHTAVHSHVSVHTRPSTQAVDSRNFAVILYRKLGYPAIYSSIARRLFIVRMNTGCTRLILTLLVTIQQFPLTASHKICTLMFMMERSIFPCTVRRVLHLDGAVE